MYKYWVLWWVDLECVFVQQNEGLRTTLKEIQRHIAELGNKQKQIKESLNRAKNKGNYIFKIEVL